ncbi:MAG: hypothetical protein WCR55_06225 [Lentisphaerota bacterium]
MNKLTRKIILLLCVLIMAVSAKASPLLLVGYPAQDPDLDTLRSGLFYPGDESFSFLQKQFFIKNTFYNRGMVYSISILKDHPDLRYKLWLQPNPANIVVLLPGLGSNYTSSKITAFAELFYLKGYSVLAISDVFNWEFSESASSVLTPGFTPVDSEDIYFAVSKILNRIELTHPKRIKDKLLVGYSMGALHTLFIADLETKLGSDKIGFSRYLALNPPVDLLYATKKLDSYYAIAASWSQKQIDQAIARAVDFLSKLNGKKFNQNDKVPMTKDEARYVIGFDFHNSLVELIFSINSREDLGVIKAQSSWFSRDAVYKEIEHFTFEDYLVKFLENYYSNKLNIKMTTDELNKSSSLIAIENTLKNNDKIRVIDTQDDFLVSKEQEAWLANTLGGKLTTLSNGGHLGYLHFRQASDLICSKLSD